MRAPFTMAHAIVDGMLNLSGSFRGGVTLSETKIKGAAFFIGGVHRDFLCIAVDFGSDAHFGSATFEKLADFSRSIFRKGAYFSAPVFKGSSKFELTEFYGLADFSVAGGEEAQLAEMNFSGAKFLSRVRFTNRKFASTLDFTGGEFHVAPEFHGAKLHQDTRFPRIEGFFDVLSENAQAAYRTLRLAMEQHSARHEEAMFYALEQRTMRARKVGQTIWERSASYLYDKLSNFGQHFGRPLVWLVLVWAVSSFGYAFWASGPIDPQADVDWVLIGNSMAFSLQQVVNPFWVWRLEALPLHLEPATLAKVIATVQALVTTGLFALSLLALRWRFKRD